MDREALSRLLVGFSQGGSQGMNRLRQLGERQESETPEGQDFLRKLIGSGGPLSGEALFRQQPGTDRNIPISSLFRRKIGG